MAGRGVNTGKVDSHTATQTQDLDVISAFWTRQCQQSRGEKHGLVIRVRDQEQYTFVLESGEGCAQCAGVHPKGKYENGH